MRDSSLTSLKATLLTHFPDLAEARFTLHTIGWHSIAVDVDDRLIFKFPRHDEAERALRTEASLLRVIRPAVTMPVPDLVLYDGPPPFSRHAKLPGEHLVGDDYARLSHAAKQTLADDLALFYAQLHALDRTTMSAAGAAPVHPWPSPERILAQAWPVLPMSLRAVARKTVDAWRDLPPDPLGDTYGFFDGHGWNMAFDHARGTLAGIYDFADSGFGDVHREFVYSNFIAPDLTERIVGAYEVLTARALDRERIDILTGAFRFAELGGAAQDEPAHLPLALKNVENWASWRRR